MICGKCNKEIDVFSESFYSFCGNGADENDVCIHVSCIDDVTVRALTKAGVSIHLIGPLHKKYICNLIRVRDRLHESLSGVDVKVVDVEVHRLEQEELDLKYLAIQEFSKNEAVRRLIDASAYILCGVDSDDVIENVAKIVELVMESQ